MFDYDPYQHIQNLEAQQQRLVEAHNELARHCENITRRLAQLEQTQLTHTQTLEQHNDYWRGELR